MLKASINSLPTARYGSNFKVIIFKLIIQNSSLGTRREIAPLCSLVTQNLTGQSDDNIVLGNGLMCQATSHNLKQTVLTQVYVAIWLHQVHVPMCYWHLYGRI